MNGELILHYTDGTSDNLGKITGTSDDASPTEWFNFRAISPNELQISIKDEFKNLPQKLIIPSEYTGIPVASISEHGFYSCPYLQEVYIPSSVHTIGDYTFTDLKNLKTVLLSDGLLSIGNSMFSGCTSLTYLEIPSTVTSIGSGLLGPSTAPLVASVSKLVFKETAGWTYVDSSGRAKPIAQETVSDSALMAQLLTGKAKYNGDNLRNCTFYRTAD